ncbi:serine-repeat antigen 4 (SERA), partial [Plasmodium ovale curtisi]
MTWCSFDTTVSRLVSVQTNVHMYVSEIWVGLSNILIFNGEGSRFKAHNGHTLSGGGNMRRSTRKLNGVRTNSFAINTPRESRSVKFYGSNRSVHIKVRRSYPFLNSWYSSNARIVEMLECSKLEENNDPLFLKTKNPLLGKKKKKKKEKENNGIFSIHVTQCTGGGAHWPPHNMHTSNPGNGNKTGDSAIPPSSGNLSTSASGSTGSILPECTGESKGEDVKGGACSNSAPIEDLTLDRIEVVSIDKDGEDVEEGQNNEEKTENYIQKIIHSRTHSTVSHIRERTTDEPNIIEIKSALLRDYNGVKVTGPCKAVFQMFLVPHITVNVETNKNSITLGPKLVQAHKKERVTTDGVDAYTEHIEKGLMFEKEEKKLLNKCADGKSFKFVLFIEGNKLTVKWKVYDATEAENSNKQVDVRTYLMKSMDRPFTSIQIHSASISTSTFLLENQCDAIASNCFMSGNVDIEKCYHCTLLIENTDTSNVCFNYVSPEVKEKFKEIKINAQEEEDPLEVELKQSIETILEEISKQKIANNSTENLHYHLSDLLKREMVKYCQMLKEADTSGVFEYVQMGNEADIFYNLTKLLKKHEDEMDFLLQRKLRNAAICMKNADEWVTRKMGLILPQLPTNNMEYTNGTYYSEDKEREKYKWNCDGTVDLETVANVDMSSSHFVEKMFCNEEYCDRWKDKNGCFSKIGASDQGNCATSWIFASKMHLETIKCMKGYDHVSSSALYVANCSEKDVKEKCTV